MVYRGYYYEKNLCVMITHYNVFRRFFRTIYIVAIIYEQIMNSQFVRSVKYSSTSHFLYAKSAVFYKDYIKDVLIFQIILTRS